MSHIKNIGKGVSKEFPFLRKILEEYDSEEKQELNRQFNEEKIQTLKDLGEAINKLNPNKGRQMIAEAVVHGPRPYYSKTSCSGEYFDADKLKIELRDDDSSRLFIVFLVKLIFHNDDRDTTIYNISLTAFTEDKTTTTIPDMIKGDDGTWEKFDIDELACRINKNSSKRLCFRFISRDFLIEPEVLIKLTLKHTSGDSEVFSSSEFNEKIDNLKWAKGSSCSSSVPTDPCPYPSPPIPSLGNTDDKIPKM